MQVQVRLGNQQFSITGINLDVSFLFAEQVPGIDEQPVHHFQGDLEQIDHIDHYEM